MAQSRATPSWNNLKVGTLHTPAKVCSSGIKKGGLMKIQSCESFLCLCHCERACLAHALFILLSLKTADLCHQPVDCLLLLGTCCTESTWSNTHNTTYIATAITHLAKDRQGNIGIFLHIYARFAYHVNVSRGPNICNNTTLTSAFFFLLFQVRTCVRWPAIGARKKYLDRC